MNHAASLYQIFSRRQIQILRLMLDGNSDKEIAQKLSISFNTVRTHHRNILLKTDRHSIMELFFHAKEMAWDIELRNMVSYA